LLKRALTHSSANAKVSNERLEFLGDRVLGLVIAERLHKDFPSAAEGELTQKVHALVRWEACAQAAEEARLWSDLSRSLSTSDSGGKSRGTILGAACEAVIAALYLDGGIEAARRFIECYWADQFLTLGTKELRDAKTLLQQWSQRMAGNAQPSYRIVEQRGPDHAPTFVVEVSVAGYPGQLAEGKSRREAEQNAARLMLDRETAQ